jgi:GTP diphosphokinase / guanosine-3',5'-bis(diphosphate) 3'-diphosphatase
LILFEKYAYNRNMTRSIENIIKIYTENNKNISPEQLEKDIALITKTWEFTCIAHQNQKRLSGDEYITHCLETSLMLAKMNLDVITICAGLLHDVPEESEFTINDIKKEFGEEIACIVEGDTKIGRIKYMGEERYAENLRKMFMAMSKDIRVMLVRFADRIHNLKTLQYHEKEEKRRRIALESLEIYAPIAGRLGMYKIKEQIEDLSFKYVYPEEYLWTIKELHSHIIERAKSLNKTKKSLINLLKKNNISFIKIYGRKKRLYPLYQKLLRKNRDITKIYDLIALRIIVENSNDCYIVLGLIHNNWEPLNGRVKDYIAQPKPNGYQSLHTTIYNESRSPIEIQIRTEDMDTRAELGIAAHWIYKENKKVNFKDKKFAWIKDIIKWQEKVKDNKDYLKSITLGTDLFKTKIFVFTPKNDVIELPEKSTPIDFAYHIHTDIGNKCIGVKINNKMAKLDSVLSNGDIVEILLDKKRMLPNPEWLNIAQTNTAREKIRHSLSHSGISILKRFRR